MDLRNFEYAVPNATPVSGAAVVVYEAVETGAHGAAVSFTDHNGAVGAATTSNADGMWEANNLPEGVDYDIKVTYANQIKWYKGKSRHNVTFISSEVDADPDATVLPNGGQDTWNVNGLGSIVIPTTAPAAPNAADGWRAYAGTGDSGTVSAEPTTRRTNSKYAAKCVHVRSAGQYQYEIVLPDVLVQQLRGREYTFAFDVFQLTASSRLIVYITDSVGTSLGVVTGVVDAWTTLPVTRTINAAATSIIVGVKTDRSDAGSKTFFVDNAILAPGAQTPEYTATLFDMTPDVCFTTVDDTLVAATIANGASLRQILSALANQVKAITAQAGWRTAPTTTLAALLTQVLTTLPASIALRVAKVGDTMSGNLRLNNNIAVSGKTEAGTDRNLIYRTTAAGGDRTMVGDTNTEVSLIGGSTPQYVTGAETGKLWTSLNDGPASGLDADLLDGSEGAAYLARANHTGSQLAATISNLATAILARSQHTGTQLASTISDLATAVATMTAAVANNIADGAVSTTAKLSNLVVTDAKVATANKDGAAGTVGMRTLGTGASQAAAGDHAHAGVYDLVGHTHADAAKIQTGTYTGDGTTRQIGVDFAPKFVFIQRTSGTGMGWILADHDGIQLNIGTSNGNISGNTLESNHFVVNNTGGTNVSGVTYLWVAFG